MRMLRKNVIRQALESIALACCQMEDYPLIADNLNIIWSEIKDHDWFSSVTGAKGKAEDDV